MEPEPGICGDATLMTQLTFDHNSPNVDYEDNLAEIQRVANDLNKEDGGLVLTVGRATAIGEDAYNLRLSDVRAACASRCIREHLHQPDRFEFREVAKGETITPEDIPGTNPESRRVDVILCRDVEYEGGRYSDEASDLLPDVSVCGCPPG